MGVSIPTVDSMIRQGMPVKSRGFGGAAGGFQIDIAEVMKWQVEKATSDISERLEAVNLDEARRRKVAAEAAMAELDLALKRADAVSLSDVSKQLEGMFTAFKYRCLAIPAKLAPALVAETDLVAVRGMLEREIHEALEELSRIMNPSQTFVAPPEAIEAAGDKRGRVRCGATPDPLTRKAR